MNDEGSFLGEAEAEEYPVGASDAGTDVAFGSEMEGGGAEPAPKGEPAEFAAAAAPPPGNSDDDERPIRSLFRTKRPRLSKKGGPPTAEALAMEGPRAAEGTPGEMDDTLASLRKKLKAPKRVKSCSSGSGGPRAKNSSFLDKAEDVGASLVVREEESGLSSTKRNAEEAIMGGKEDVGHSSSDGLEDSLSAFFRKAHSARKSVSRGKRQVEETVGSAAVLVSRRPPLCREISYAEADDATAMANEVVKKSAPRRRSRKSRNGSAVESTELGNTVLARVEQASDDETLKERMSVDVEKASSSVGRTRGRRSAVNKSGGLGTRNSRKLSVGISIEGTVKTTKSDVNEENMESSLPQTLGCIPALTLKDKSVILEDNKLQGGHTYDVGLKQTCTGRTLEGVPSGPVQETNCPSVIQTVIEETQSLEGLKQCSYGKLNNKRVVELSASSVSRKREEIHDSEYNGELKGPLQESSEGAPLTHVVISQPPEELLSESYGRNLHDQVKGSCSTHIKQALGESLAYNDLLSQSLGCVVDKEVDFPLNDCRVNGLFVETHKEIGVQGDCINKLQFGMYPFSHQETSPMSSSDVFSQKYDKPLEELSTSPFGRMKNETRYDFNASLDMSPHIADADCTSMATHNSNLSKVTMREIVVADGFLQSGVVDVPFEAGQPSLLPSTGNKKEVLTADDSKPFPEKVSEAHEQTGISPGDLPFVPVHDNLTLVETNSAGSQAATATTEEFSAADISGLPENDIYSIDKQKAPPRTTRKAKRHRHGDMAYEGDADWEVLMHDVQGPFGYTTIADEEQHTINTFKCDSDAFMDSHDGGWAAVATGLKAYALGPIEKIKFKDVLKCKGGLQDYLECRNLILCLWSRDVSRILSLEDCGVTDAPSKDESSRAALIRRIYTFLDNSGYINGGIASKKKKPCCSILHSELSKEDVNRETCVVEFADSKNEDAFTFSQVNASEDHCPEDKVSLLDAEAKNQETSVPCTGPEWYTIQPVEHTPAAARLVESASPVAIIQPVMDNNVLNEICPGLKVRQGDGSCDSVMNDQVVESGDFASNGIKDIHLSSSEQQLDGEKVMVEPCLDQDARSLDESCSSLLRNNVSACKYAHAQNCVARLSPKCTVTYTEVPEIGEVSISKQVETLSIVSEAAETKSEEIIHVEDLGVDSHKAKNSQVKEADSAIHLLDVPPSAPCNLEKVCRRIIIVGAGPAGITAARHLQRQGFSVTVLEARDRIGGRVYTDRSSLSVPVDLGASIITGVEADVATERRADPSSLICTQLGLQLTILNSDCPLYDVVTGKKVPTNLDEALEAEYNSLLDDMIVLVAQSGEGSERMSLEDGLEYALRKRRMFQSTSPTIDTDQVKFGGDSGSLEFSTSSPMVAEDGIENKLLGGRTLMKDVLSPLERRVMNWHFANLEYGCAAPLKEVSLPHWNQDDVYGGFGGAHCMIKEGYSKVMETLSEGIDVHLKQVVTSIEYDVKDLCSQRDTEVRVSTADGSKYLGDAVLVTVPLGCLKANTIKFFPSLPDWKMCSIQRLGFGVLNKVVLEFPQVFWDDTVDYFGTTAEETSCRGQCFMFWNVRKTVGAPVLIALVVGKAAIDGQNIGSSDHVNHALIVLRKIFGEKSVPDPVASVVTNWGLDPFSRGAYSYVAVGASGEDYDILGRPVANCLFFAGEATCKEHPDTVGGAMMSGLREAVCITDIFNTGNDYTAEVESMEAAQRRADNERNEAKDFVKRLDLCKHANVTLVAKDSLLQDMFRSAKSIPGRLHLAKELLRLPIDTLKSFAGTKEGLSILNSWMLDSMGKDATQLLRHCVRLLVLVSTDLLAVRLSGIGKTVKDKVCVHTSRDIRTIASQLVNVWIEIFRKEKTANNGQKLSRQSVPSDSSKLRSRDVNAGRQPEGTNEAPEGRGNSRISPAASYSRSSASDGNRGCSRTTKMEPLCDKKSDSKNSSQSHHVAEGLDLNKEGTAKSKALSAAEAARAAKAARLAAEAYASSEADSAKPHELPKILSFHKFVRREQYTQMDESDLKRKKLAGSILGWQDCISEIDSRNCRVQNWSVDFSATCANFDGPRLSADNCAQRSCSNDITCPANLKEHSGESEAVNSRLTKAWVDTDTAGSGGVKDSLAIERWQSQAMEADAQFFSTLKDEEGSNNILNTSGRKHQAYLEESSASQAGESRLLVKGQQRGAENIKQGVVDYVASLLMPLYKARKIDKEGYKSIMKKTATKVMEQCTEAEKIMTIFEFLDYRRKNKIRSFVDKLIEWQMSMNPSLKS